ncbi:hypothetical protein V6Z11_D02G108800 [Gossypium hirsutum]
MSVHKKETKRFTMLLLQIEEELTFFTSGVRYNPFLLTFTFFTFRGDTIFLHIGPIAEFNLFTYFFLSTNKIQSIIKPHPNLDHNIVNTLCMQYKYLRTKKSLTYK